MEGKRRQMHIPVLMLYGDGTEDVTDAWISVSDEEYELLRQCCREGRDIGSFQPLAGLEYRAIESVVYSLSLYSANDNIGMPGGLDNLELRVCMPDEIRALEEK